MSGKVVVAKGGVVREGGDGEGEGGDGKRVIRKVAMAMSVMVGIDGSDDWWRGVGCFGDW